MEVQIGEGLTMRGYARHRKEKGLSGGSHVAVSKAIQDGRIAEAVDKSGKIDPVLADRLWEERTRPGSPFVSPAAPSEEREDSARNAVGSGTDGGSASPPSESGDSYAQQYAGARARLTAAQAAEAELELAERMGKLIPLEVYEQRLAGILDRLRRQIDAIPGGWAHRLADRGNDPEAMQLELKQLSRELCSELLQEGLNAGRAA